ncbi:macro domain-containing protein [Sphingobacterium sp. UBA3549]|uniref:macro domain-containing protein n=1 Tax=Sphingobacterium sp. UBA3549 TaxID=1947496 RepID=UPI0025D75075|nr:macro domain-containing protein [Sphingobacterium sp. UBA3549]
MVNTVNTDGVTGKGIALQFKNEYPGNYKEYRKRVKTEISVSASYSCTRKKTS